MANTEHVETLDSLDKVSVITYRLGITLFSFSLFLCSLTIANDMSLILIDGSLKEFAFITLAISSAMSAANLHVYDKKIRIVITWSAWIGLVLLSLLIGSHLVWIAIGFLFVTFSGIALKESFCFKVLGLKFIPFLLCAATFMLAMEKWVISLICLTIAGVIFLFLAIQKWKMPLHFDIGNKSNYQH
ncbi:MULTISPECIES: DUF2301 domain-containing membrane protein [unclassified Aliivibrio]|uniref:DUF2301 domain-containing membrane protein n=1 Tax=unclassified Aliivibrio TaxID=2645654 RepID=UPI00080DE67F|nr:MULTISPECIES: DUF2301 domain-containing membrane protein [unclassified Aliivibrio]OCH13044.1 hypothetical protein A6E05_07830 [Aliivibrio sp. 1S165]OCH25055.1 hypothetical protein A6E03_04630 [Aliivibrio sp. 1S128]OCH28267.1 hypothetical protein A6E06_07605 [Aliivibrio sp. 1S175]